MLSPRRSGLAFAPRLFARQLMLCIGAILLSYAPVGESHLSYATPRSSKIPLTDATCDGALLLSTFGDSVAYGRGDTLHGNRGGYLLQLQRKVEGAKQWNVGFPGYEVLAFRRKVLKELEARGGRTYIGLKKADHIILDIGRNDFWIPVRKTGAWTEADAVRTARDIKRLARLLLENSEGIVSVATLGPAARPQQQAFVSSVNRYLVRWRSSAFPVELRFDFFDATVLGDLIHPSSAGYIQYATYALNVVKALPERRAQKRALSCSLD